MRDSKQILKVKDQRKLKCSKTPIRQLEAKEYCIFLFLNYFFCVCVEGVSVCEGRGRTMIKNLRVLHFSFSK